MVVEGWWRKKVKKVVWLGLLWNRQSPPRKPIIFACNKNFSNDLLWCLKWVSSHLALFPVAIPVSYSNSAPQPTAILGLTRAGLLSCHITCHTPTFLWLPRSISRSAASPPQFCPRLSPNIGRHHSIHILISRFISTSSGATSPCPQNRVSLTRWTFWSSHSI